MQIYTWDRQGFEAAYWKQYYKQLGCGATRARNCACAERDMTYCREFFEDDRMFKIRAQNIVDKLSLSASTDIFVVGCALGLLMEELSSLGMNVWGCDNSQYIQAIKNKEKAKFPIHNLDITADDFINKLGRATGALWFDVVVTEDVLTSHDSYTSIFNNCEAVLNPDMPKTNIVHLVDTNCKSPFVGQSLSAWAALNPTHTWLDGLGGSL